MTIKSFLKFVEIQTKVASVIPYFLGLVYTLYNFNRLKPLQMIIMFIAMILFDMTVTAINNYFDYKRAIKKHGYNYEVHNAIVQYKLNPKVAVATIVILFSISVGLALYLVSITNLVVLAVGIFCYVIGFAYSYGPLPISRTPFGEIFSGFTMGFGILFLTVYINIFDSNILEILIYQAQFYMSFDIKNIIGIALVSLPVIFSIANIMLANNICDIEDDIENNRHTLPTVIGKEKALTLLRWLFYLSYAAITAGVALRVLPLYSLLVWLTLIVVNKKINTFKQHPTKKDTFGEVVSSFVLINTALIITFILGILDGAFLNWLV